MKTTLKTIFIAAVFALPFVAYGAHHEQEHGASNQHEQHGSSRPTAMGTGVVHSVDSAERKINLTHDPIPDLRWPAMTMDLDVAESVDLQDISPDEKIQFQIQLGTDQVYRITDIIKADTTK